MAERPSARVKSLYRESVRSGPGDPWNAHRVNCLGIGQKEVNDSPEHMASETYQRSSIVSPDVFPGGKTVFGTEAVQDCADEETDAKSQEDGHGHHGPRYSGSGQDTADSEEHQRPNEHRPNTDPHVVPALIARTPNPVVD